MTTIAKVRFNIPDLCVPAEERGLFAVAASKEAIDLDIPLRDVRTSADIKVVAADGVSADLDQRGFTYVKHRSALAESKRWFLDQDFEEIYLPETCDLICRVTGAKKAVINNCAFRRKLAENQEDPTSYLRKGCKLDQELMKLPRDDVLVYGKQDGGSLEPARSVHVDYTFTGLSRTIRECRSDITEAAQEVIHAEDARARGEDVTVPRYAVYSVWRPISTVKRDPLVVCDYQTLNPDDLSSHEYRALSEQNDNGEYMMQYWSMAPPKDVEQNHWYWMSEQQADEVLIIKFADSAAERDSSVARYCPHGAAAIPGTEEQEPRSSVECRVLAFW